MRCAGGDRGVRGGSILHFPDECLDQDDNRLVDDRFEEIKKLYMVAGPTPSKSRPSGLQMPENLPKLRSSSVHGSSCYQTWKSPTRRSRGRPTIMEPNDVSPVRGDRQAARRRTLTKRLPVIIWAIVPRAPWLGKVVKKEVVSWHVFHVEGFPEASFPMAPSISLLSSWHRVIRFESSR